MARILFTHEPTPDGAILRLMEKRWPFPATPIPVAAWADRMADQAFSGISRILALVDDVESAVEHKEDGLFIDHKTVASLSEPQALGLGLPPSVRFALQVNTKNLITDHDFRISGRWVDEANRSLRVERDGAFLLVEGNEYRLPEPLFSLVSAIDDFASNETSNNDVRMERLADLQSLLPQEAQKQLSIDSYFSNFRVMHASACSLSLRIEGRSFDFDPVLFGRRVIERHRAEDDQIGPVSEAESLLTEHQQSVFSRERFRASDDVKPSYLIEPGIYLHLDPSLRSAMSVVRQMQRADPESRRRFVQASQLYLKEALSTVLADDEVERLFVETEQYSARVIDIGVWTPPVIPWIKKEPNDWLPEKFGLKVGNQYVVLTTDDVAPLREMIKEAREEGKEFVEFGEEKIRIPSTVEAEQSLSHLLGAIAPSPVPGKRIDLPIGPSEEIPHQKRVLIVEENFDKLGFIRKTAPRKRATQSLPAAIRPSLMKHQQSGLDWMQETWLSGYAGVLLADDMGLGKTLQALGFLAWLREVAAANRSLGGLKGPIIIVAPTGLLANWEKEHDNHLHNPGLGEICRAYGRHLKILKTVSTRDIDRGAPSLDHRRIQQASWVLTTYETLRDHHLSFASIPFSCAVFDEMQKVKSPSSLLTRAAKTLNAEFTLGLTGTPIENQLADLWCIVDIINPGCLGDLKF
jgi:SNF2 family DNA or RNA helicase